MKRYYKTLLTTTLLGLFFSAPMAFAQDAGGGDGNISDDLNVIEMELDKSAPVAPRPTTPTVNTQRLDDDKSDQQGPGKMTDFSGLGRLAPFSEVSVIQKRFLPKTQRFQFTGAFTTITNNPWFFTAGVSIKLAYYFTESLGIEGMYNNYSSSQRKTSEELYDAHGVSADSFGFPKSYIGVDAKYTPFYGKMTWLNKKIIPFDHYFTAGAGNTQVSTGGNGPTLHVGTGQTFALSKRFAFNWDFSGMFYTAKTTSGESQSFNDLLFTIGMSFFYPEAKYR